MRGSKGNITQKLADVVDEKDVASGNGFPVDTYRELVEHCAVLAYLNNWHWRAKKEKIHSVEHPTTLWGL